MSPCKCFSCTPTPLVAFLITNPLIPSSAINTLDPPPKTVIGTSFSLANFKAVTKSFFEDITQNVSAGPPIFNVVKFLSGKSK